MLHYEAVDSRGDRQHYLVGAVEVKADDDVKFVLLSFLDPHILGPAQLSSGNLRQSRPSA